jgi:UDP-N-acetylmuramate dehydrogenase
MNTLACGIVHQNVSLANYTSWRVGGIAKKLYLPADIDDLKKFVQTIPSQEPILFIGLGSNLLIRDGGVDGTTIITQRSLNKLSLLETNLVRAEAGVSCAQMARFCARNNLEGIEFLAGIPGTIGGALAMNAGCSGGETWEYVEKVETIDFAGKHHTRLANAYQVGYRSVTQPQPEWFVAGYFRLRCGKKEDSLEKIRQLLERRAATQPTNEPSCGSVFRNPPGDYAGRLIEACDLKGLIVGGASVSNKHANFIVNQGNATASDIETLINRVKNSVAEAFGIHLIQEVRIVGSFE